VPEALMQAGSQALGAATQGLSGLAQPKMDHPGTGDPGLGSADLGGAGGGGDAPTTPAAGGGMPDLLVALVHLCPTDAGDRPGGGRATARAPVAQPRALRG
jgi:hypothetical protein